MAKFTMASTALLLVVVVLAMAEASSAIRSIVIEEEEYWMLNPAGRVKPGKCAKRMMKPEVHQLSQCQLYLGEMMQKATTTNYPGQRQDETLDMCCQELAGMDEKCRCEGLKMAVKLQMQKEQRKALEGTEGVEDAGEETTGEKTEETEAEETEAEEVQRRVKEMMMEEKMMRAAEKMYSKCNLTPCSCYMSRAE